MADSPCMKNRSLKAGGRLNRWSLKAGFTVYEETEEPSVMVGAILTKQVEEGCLCL